ncbi:MAG: hypothetical protein IPM17_01915 [Verrucomicrobia bacterium]|nr:hypothetical protein [Verrucomicrobiota bacterium]
MKRNTLMGWALAGLMTASLTLATQAGEPASPAGRPERAQVRDRLRDRSPDERLAIREWLRDATPEQRRAARERLQGATPERRQAIRERFRQASPEEREAMLDRLTRPERPGRATDDLKAPEGSRPPRGSADQRPGRGPAFGAGGPPPSEKPDGLAAPRRERLQNRLEDLRARLAHGNLSPDEQRELARLQNWENPGRPPGAPSVGRGPGRGPGAPGAWGPSPRAEGNRPGEVR